MSKKDKATVLRMASNDADVWVRYHFCYAIPHLCSRVTPRIRGILARFLNDASWHVRYAALEVMENLSITDHRFCEAAVRALKDSQWNVRCAAARAVTLCMCSYSPAIEALGNATKDSNCCVRASVTEAMGSAGRQSGLNAIVELLTRMISDPDVEVQIKAFSAAAQFLKELASITSALRRVLKGKEEKGPRKGVGSL
ncbi:MAG: HEAT repeat domain-containing protein [Planctomycetota bacterium]